MRAGTIVAALSGLAVMAALVALFGAGAVLRSLLAIGWSGFAAICLIQLGLIAVMGLAWRGLAPEAPPGPSCGAVSSAMPAPRSCRCPRSGAACSAPGP